MSYPSNRRPRRRHPGRVARGRSDEIRSSMRPRMRLAIFSDLGVSICSSSISDLSGEFRMRLGAPAEMHDDVIVGDGGQGVDHVAARLPFEFRQQDGLRPVPAEPAQDDGRRPPDRLVAYRQDRLPGPRIPAWPNAHSRIANSRISGSPWASRGPVKVAGSRSDTARAARSTVGSRAETAGSGAVTMPASISRACRRPDLREGLDHRHLFRQETVLPEARKPAPQALEGRQGAVAEAALDDKGAEQVCLGNPRARQPGEKFFVRQPVRTEGPGGSNRNRRDGPALAEQIELPDPGPPPRFRHRSVWEYAFVIVNARSP